MTPSEEEDGGGSYDVLKVWEMQLMMTVYGGREDLYSLVPVRDRARFICATHLSDWVSALDSRKRMSELSKNAPGGNTPEL